MNVVTLSDEKIVTVKVSFISGSISSVTDTSTLPYFSPGLITLSWSVRPAKSTPELALPFLEKYLLNKKIDSLRIGVCEPRESGGAAARKM